MNLNDMPTMSSSAYVSNNIALGALTGGAWNLNQPLHQDYVNLMLSPKTPTITQEKSTMATTTRRIVKVFIADTNDNIPLEKQIIYKGEEKFTDMNDQELFFEIELAGLLKDHNAERVKIADKSIKDRTEFLEPVRIRDLKMTVVTIASF